MSCATDMLDRFWSIILKTPPEDLKSCLGGSFTEDKKQQVIDHLWQKIPIEGKHLQDARLHAAAALALLDPGNTTKWETAANVVAKDLVEVPAVHLVFWHRLFKNIKEHLIAACGEIYRHPKTNETHRSHAIEIITEYAKDEEDTLIDFLLDAEPGHFDGVYKAAEGFLKGESSPGADLDCDLDVKKSSSQEKVCNFKKTNRNRVRYYHDRRWKRQANQLVTLALLGNYAPLLHHLKHCRIPSLRSYLIHRLAPSKIIHDDLLRFAKDTKLDISVRTALVLCLGEFELTQDQMRSISDGVLRELFMHPDAGLRAATEWLVRKWKLLPQFLHDYRDALHARTLKEISSNLPRAGERPTWYVQRLKQQPSAPDSSSYHIMVVLPPCSKGFRMGSPLHERGRSEAEPYTAHIPYSLAISAHAVAWGQFLNYLSFDEFVKTLDEDDRETVKIYKGDAEDPDDEVGQFNERPANYMTWHMAARYCNWLSVTNPDESLERCFKRPENTSESILYSEVDAYKRLNGYRLPTEVEMENATRAGTTTARYSGQSDILLDQYAWYAPNAENNTHPVGELKPTEFGLFDMLGNVSEWCENYQPPKIATEPNKNETIKAPLRGGMYFDQWSDVRSAYSYPRAIDLAMNFTGFRLARTIVAPT